MENYQKLTTYRSNLYRLLSSVYLQVPDRGILGLPWNAAVKLLEFSQVGATRFREWNDEALKEIENGLRLVHPYLSKEDHAFEKDLLNLSKDWTHLFRGVDKGGPLPPYESLYRTGKLQEKPAQDIHRLFSKMGVHVPEEWHQPLDYIGVELDFMRLLCEKEREAWEKNGRDSVLEVVKIEESFLENHVGLWVFSFCEKMMEQAREDFYQGIAQLTKGLVEYDRIHIRNIISNYRALRGNVIKD
jgi:TorA maturation chaperone TorD